MAEMTTMYCPRCDRSKTRINAAVALQAIKDHVKKAHPEYDPQWANDTIHEEEE